MSLALSVSPLLFFICLLLGVIQGQVETGEVQLVYRQVIRVEAESARIVLFRIDSRPLHHEVMMQDITENELFIASPLHDAFYCTTTWVIS